MKAFMERDWIAIIGTREPTVEQEDQIAGLIADLDPEQHTIISGCAYGIDSIALRIGSSLGFDTIGVLPWPKYNEDIQEHCSHIICIDEFNQHARQEAYDSVRDHHPASAHLSQGARKLHARNYGIIRWAVEVIAAPGNKPGGGGTGQGIRLAEVLKIPVTIIKP